ISHHRARLTAMFARRFLVVPRRRAPSTTYVLDVGCAGQPRKRMPDRQPRRRWIVKTLWMGTRATGALIGLMLLVVLAVFGVLRSPLVVERETAEEMPGAETDLPDVANNLDPEATLTPASYSNPKVGVQWRAPSSDWYFAEFPSPDFDDSSVH